MGVDTMESKMKKYSIDDHFQFEQIRELRASDGAYILKGRMYKCNYCPAHILEKYCKEHYEYLHTKKKPKYNPSRVTFDKED